MMLQDRPVLKAELKLSSEEDEESFVQWYDEGKYKDRKFKAVNSLLKTILSIAFQIPEEQMVEESLLPLDHYTMKVVVPEGKESLLRSTIEETIEAKIGINIRHELRNTRAAVLRSLETGLVKIDRTISSNCSFHRGLSEISCKATSMDEFALLLSTSSLNM